MQALLGGFGLLRGGHAHKPKTTRAFGYTVTHDPAVLNLTILLEHFAHVDFREVRMNATNKKVGAGAGINGTISAMIRWCIVPDIHIAGR